MQICIKCSSKNKSRNNVEIQKFYDYTILVYERKKSSNRWKFNNFTFNRLFSSSEKNMLIYKKSNATMLTDIIIL